MAALAADLDLEHVAGGGVCSRQDADLAERVEGEEMRADHHVDAFHDAGLDELARAARPELLGVLEDEADLAGQLVAPLVQRVQRREQHRRVAVVAARMHDAGVLGGELEAGLLLDRQRVDVGAQRERLPRPPGAERGDEARLRRPVELEPFHAAEQLEEERRGLVLLEAQLRVLMEVPPPRDRLRFQLRCDERAHSESSEKSAMAPTLSRTSASRPSRLAFSCSFSCITSTSSKKRWTVGASSVGGGDRRSEILTCKHRSRCVEPLTECLLGIVLETILRPLGYSALGKPRRSVVDLVYSSEHCGLGRREEPCAIRDAGDVGRGRPARGAGELDRHVEQPFEALFDELAHIRRQELVRDGDTALHCEAAEAYPSTPEAVRVARAGRPMAERERHRKRVDPVSRR